MALSNKSAAGGAGGGSTFVTTVIPSCTSCILENCYCGILVSGAQCSQVKINDACFASPNVCCSPNTTPFFLKKGTSICSTGAGGNIILSGYFFD